VKKFVKQTKRVVFDGSADQNWAVYRPDDWTSTYCKFQVYVGNLKNMGAGLANYLTVANGITTGGTYLPNTFMTHENGNLYVALEISGVNSVETWKAYL
jgi:hypothetical protein